MIDIKARSAECRNFISDTNSEESIQLYEKAIAMGLVVLKKALCRSEMQWEEYKRAGLDQIDQMKRESQVQSNVERLR